MSQPFKAPHLLVEENEEATLFSDRLGFGNTINLDGIDASFDTQGKPVNLEVGSFGLSDA